MKRVLRITIGDLSALLVNVNQIRKTPEAIAGIQINIKNNPAIEAQFKEALTIKKEGLIPPILDRLSINYFPLYQLNISNYQIKFMLKYFSSH